MNKRFVEIRKALNLTQVEIGERLGVSRSVIANIEYNRVEPSELIVKLICKEFGVDEVWLRTGAGKMFRQVSRDEEVAAFFMSALSGDDSFKRAFVTALSQIDDDGWKLIRDFAQKLNDAQKDRD